MDTLLEMDTLLKMDTLLEMVILLEICVTPVGLYIWVGIGWNGPCPPLKESDYDG